MRFNANMWILATWDTGKNIAVVDGNALERPKMEKTSWGSAMVAIKSVVFLFSNALCTILPCVLYKSQPAIIFSRLNAIERIRMYVNIVWTYSFTAWNWIIQKIKNKTRINLTFLVLGEIFCLDLDLTSVILFSFVLMGFFFCLVCFLIRN